MKKEAKWQILWNKYLRENPEENPGFYELKQTSNEYFYYRHFQKHQIMSLLIMRSNGLIWKLSDADPREKPCDCISIPPMPAYVVVKYPRAFVMIEIMDFVSDRDTTKLKALSYEHAIDIATKIIHV